MQQVANMPDKEPVTKGWEAFHTGLSFAIAKSAEALVLDDG
jgi:hypothetical protein